MNFFTLLTKFAVIILPFYVFFAVFFTNIVGIPKAGFFIKELVVVLLFLSLVYEFFKNKLFPKFELIDYLIFGYIGYGIGITLYNGLGIESIVYGGRYDFMFLIVFQIFKHGNEFLKVSLNKLLKLFLYSGIGVLLFSIMLKFRFGEEFLIEFGYVNYSPSWAFSGGIPIYHGLENSGIRRFQGIMDGPNAMAYFLIFFSGVFLYLQKKKTEFYVLFIVAVLFWLLLNTFSRSSILGVFSAIGLLFLLNLKVLFRNYRKLMTYGLIFLLSFGGILTFIFQDNIKNIVIRTSSTKGHFERMAIGLERFAEKPMGAGLAESGPGFRAIYPEKQTHKDEIYYIPESWLIQQLIEGGIIFFTLFVTIFLLILSRLYKHSKIIFGVLIAILTMNVFLHIFEATYISMLVFIFIGLFYSKNYNKRVKI